MRVMTWNILTGGVNADSTSRLERIEAVLTQARPDVVALQEANHFNARRNALLRRLGRSLGLRGYLAQARSGYHVALFVQPTWTVEQVSTQTRQMHHALLHVRVRPPASPPLALFSCHLSPFDAQTRLQEVEAILARLQSLPSEVEALVMGDLNCLDHHRDHTDLANHMSARELASYLTPQGQQDERVTRRLEQAGLVDLGWHLEPDPDAFTVPTSLGRHTKEFIRTRLDYLWATAGLASRATHYHVLRTPDTDQASDHYPLVVDFTG